MADSKNVFTATDQNFDSEVLPSAQLTLLDFWAEWCGPCRILGPTLEKIADEYAGKIKVYKMNTEENPATPTRYGIRGIPTIIFFKGGQMVDQLVGNYPRDIILQTVNKHIG